MSTQPDNYAGRGGPQPTSKQVISACERVASEQSKTFDLLATLEANLAGVLRSAGPEVTNVQNPQSVLVPLASTIHGCADRAARINEQLMSILERLEV